MKFFWLERPLEMKEEELLGEVLQAQYQSAYRQNSSRAVLIETARASGELTKAVAAGILTLGGKHAPLELTHNFLSLERPATQVKAILARGEKIPGWGGTFQKDKPDPIWRGVHEKLLVVAPSMIDKIDAVTARLWEQGKTIFPNPSAYTAAAAIVLEMPAKLTPYLLLFGRLPAWTEIAAGYLDGVSAIESFGDCNEIKQQE